MTGSSLSAWSIFFSTGAEAAATLAGLVMVAISVNVQRIIAHKHLPARALGAIGALVMVMVLCLAAVIPQPTLSYAIELDVATVAAWAMHVRIARRIFIGHRESGRPARERFLMLMFGQAQVLPLTVGGVLLTLGHDDGLYWIAATLIAAVVVSVINAWVLLVEILR